MEAYLEKIPVTIGITGHIDVDEEDFIKERIEFFFLELKKKLKETPLILISSLADGADLIFVEAGYKIYGDNIKLIAPLPFSKEEIEKTSKNKEKFLYYVNKSKIIDIQKEKWSLCKAPEDNYSFASEYVIKNSNILFAIWDSEKTVDENNNPLRGGTYDTIIKCLRDNKILLEESSIKYQKSTPIIQLVAKRKRNSIKNKDYGKYKFYFPNGNVSEFKNDFLYSLNQNGFSYGKILLNIEKFNIRLKKYKNNPILKILRNRFIDNEKYSSLDNSIKDLVNKFVICDYMALKMQKSYEIRLLSLFLMICLTILYSSFIGSFNIIFSLIAILMLIFWKKISSEKAHLDIRYIAEVFRILIFWKIGNIDKKISKYILKNEDGDIIWIKTVFSNLELDEIFNKKEDKKADFDLIYTNWLNNQAEYYKKNSKKCEMNDTKADKIKYGVLSCFIILHFIFGISLILKGNIPFLELNLRENLTELFLSIALFAFPAITYIQSQKAWPEHNEAYIKAGKLFEVVKNQFLNTKDDNEKENLILDISKLALTEEESWLLLHRRRKAEPLI